MTPEHFEHPPAEPLTWLREWLEGARELGLNEPTAMNLATVGADGRPSSRIVLYKAIGPEHIEFYTNYESRKGQDIASHEAGALCFFWDAQLRQIRIEGPLSRLSAQASDAYFASRDRGSQIGAWASQQSRPINSRADMEQAYVEIEARFAGQDVPRPPHWGGYALKIEAIEFWQGRPNRFHDRLVYQRESDGWRITRLQP